MVLLIVGIILFILLVVVHEYGHFLVAKRNGVEVEEFGVGFPPKIYGRKLGKGIFEGYYTINALPLGGFVRLKGENDADKRKGSFGAAKLPVKIRIMLAGVAMNLIAALVLFTIVSWMGMPQVVNNQFNVKSDAVVVQSDVIAGYIDLNSPAQKAGLTQGDVITSVNGDQINTREELRAATAANAGKTVQIAYERDGQEQTTSAQLLTTAEVEASAKTDNPKGYLGVVSTEYQRIRSTWSAPIVAIGTSVQFTVLTFKALASTFANLGKALANAVTGNTTEAKQNASAASENVAGPVGIFAVMRDGSVLGFAFILFVVALLSLSLAIMNILPIPALDGGRAFVTLYYHARKKPLTAEREAQIHGTGFAALMILFIVITIVDVRRFF